MITRLAAAALLLTLPGLAEAKQWVVDPARSEILFNYIRADQPDQGRFHRFSGEGFLDLEDLESTRLEIRIESRSIDLNDDLASAFATSAEWFDSKNHPNVTYRLTDIVQTGPETFEASGELTIRGETEQITSPIRLTFEEGSAMARGVLTIERRDFLLGVGPSAAFVTIGPKVTVDFRLQATPPPE
ncbi:MAG: YceI family protein [Pseudomonadota bacterium]